MSILVPTRTDCVGSYGWIWTGPVNRLFYEGVIPCRVMPYYSYSGCRTLTLKIL
jgi:hypothetical protein